MGWSSSDDDERILIYDLRQAYVEVISAILKQILFARQANQFNQWFMLLDDLHTEINQKLKKEERKEYYDKLNNVKKIISEKQNAFLGVSKDQNDVNEVRNALKNLEMFLKVLMEKHKMFGAKEEAELI